MKNLKAYTLIALGAITLASCSSDDDATTPEIINEEELITTVELTLTTAAGGDAIVLRSEDSDGDGPNPPVVTVSGNLMTDTVYEGDIKFLNETESPAEDITVEVEEEADEHQVFYIPSTMLNTTVAYGNFDSNNNPLGTAVTLTTGADEVSGTLTITLRHEPTKPNDGTLNGAGGETDVQVSFPVEVAN